MNTLDAIRSALRSTQPWVELDLLVRRRLNAGRTVRELIVEFQPLVDEVYETPDLTERSLDAFGDTLDALSGDCHPDSRYRDTPTVSVAPPSAASASPVVTPVG